MKLHLTFLAALIAGLFVTVHVSGQIQITTRREKLKDFSSKTTKVVLPGDPMLDEALKESVSVQWTLSPYEFCSMEEFENLKKSDSYYFLLVVKGLFRKEVEPGIDLLTLVKGGEGSDKGIGSMLEVVSFPLRATQGASGREFVLLPAFLKAIQEHVSSLTNTELKAYSVLNVSKRTMSRLRTKRIFFYEDDLSPQVNERVRRNAMDEDMMVEADEDVMFAKFTEAERNTVVSYIVAPAEPVNGSWCYKMLVGSDSHELYYYKRHKITARSGKGFLARDIKAIKAIRK